MFDPCHTNQSVSVVQIRPAASLKRDELAFATKKLGDGSSGGCRKICGESIDESLRSGSVVTIRDVDREEDGCRLVNVLPANQRVSNEAVGLKADRVPDPSTILVSDLLSKGTVGSGKMATEFRRTSAVQGLSSTRNGDALGISKHGELFLGDHSCKSGS